MFKKIFILFKVVVILNLLIVLINGEWTTAFICLCNLILFFIADMLKKKLCYGDILQLLIYLFLIGSLIGGEIYFLYVKIWYYDIILHMLSSFIVSALCFYIVKSKININDFLLCVFIFSFAMMVAAVWEVYEFSIDRFFDKDMQKDTIITEINSSLLSDDGREVIQENVDDIRIGNYVVNGYLDIGLYDTMGDIICAIVGSLIFIFMIKIKEAF